MKTENYFRFTKGVKANFNQIKKMATSVLLMALVASCTKEKTEQSTVLDQVNSQQKLSYREQKAPQFLNQLISLSKSMNKTETSFMNSDSAIIYAEDALNFALDSAVDYTITFNDSVETPISNLNTIGLNELANATVTIGRAIQTKLKAVNYAQKGIISVDIKKIGNTLKCYYNYGVFTPNGSLGKGPGGPVFVNNYWYPVPGGLANRYYSVTSPDYEYPITPDRMLIAACLYQYRTYTFTPNIVAIPQNWRKVYFNHHNCDVLDGTGTNAALNPTNTVAGISSGGYLGWNWTGIANEKYPSNSTIHTSVIPFIFSNAESIDNLLIKGSQMNYYKENFPMLIVKHKDKLSSDGVSGIYYKELSDFKIQSYMLFNSLGNPFYKWQGGYHYVLRYSNCYVTPSHGTSF